MHNNLILKNKTKYTFKEKLELIILNNFLKKNLKNAFLITTASEPFTEYLEKLKLTPSITVLNGYELDVFEKLKPNYSSYFEVSLIGTIYPEQNITLFMDAFKELEKYKDIRVNFIGTGSILEVAIKIKNT